jgi:cysteine synthase
MVAAIKGYKMILVMPESASIERRQVMRAYGADLHLVPAQASMEGAIDSRPGPGEKWSGGYSGPVR